MKHEQAEINLRAVSPWRVGNRRQLIIPPCGDGSLASMIAPPLDGVLPSYTYEVEFHEREEFWRWKKTLSPAQLATLEQAMERVTDALT